MVYQSPDLKSLVSRTYRTLDEGTLLEALEERGLIEQVMTTLNLSRASESRLSPRHDGRCSEGERMEREKQREKNLGSPQHLHNYSSSPEGMRQYHYCQCLCAHN